MENETQNEIYEDIPATEPPKRDYILPASILISAIIIAGAWVYTIGLKNSPQKLTATVSSEKTQVSELEERVLPSEGVILPVTWGDLGAKLVSVGAIDADKFKTIYEQRGNFTDEYENLLLGQSDGKLRVTKNNAGYLLNLFWALGLATKNEILDSGEMTNRAYGGAQNFASTAGWTVAKKFGVLSTPSSMHPGSLPGHTYVLIDKEGVVRYVFDDPNMGIRNDQLVAEIAKLD